jgi:hypothetical protein
MPWKQHSAHLDSPVHQVYQKFFSPENLSTDNLAGTSCWLLNDYLAQAIISI